MRILLFTSYLHLPETRGGLQSATDELCLALQEKSVDVCVLCGSSAAEGDQPIIDTDLGYKVVRVSDWRSSLKLVATIFEPSVIVVQSGMQTAHMVSAALDTGYPVAVYLHNVELRTVGGTLVPDPSLLYFANSAFTADRWKAFFGIHCHLLPPVIMPGRYHTERTGDQVLFVNPVPEKGLERMAELAAANPDIPFLVVESWRMEENWRNLLNMRFGHLQNIEWRPATADMQEIFSETRILLMPSVWEEAYGRTAVEAQISGLPVLASSRGALADVIGKGGLALDVHAPLATWSEALRKLYFDPFAWQEASDAALHNAGRQLLETSYLLDEALVRLALHASTSQAASEA